MQNRENPAWHGMLVRMKEPVKIILFTSDVNCPLCPSAVSLAQELESRAPKIVVESYHAFMDRDKSEQYGVQRTPCFAVQGRNLRFFKIYGLPEHRMLEVLADGILGISADRAWFPGDMNSPLGTLASNVPIQVFVENDCARCVPVAETAIGLALESDRIITDIVIGSQFPELMKKHGIGRLPKSIVGANLHMDGHVQVSEFLDMIFTAEGLRQGPGKQCLVCGSESQDTICAACKSRIQAEAVEHKLRSEKSGAISSRRG